MRGAASLLTLGFAVAGAATAQVDLGTDPQRAEGKQLYDKFCSQCHGETGDGIGHATYRVKPRPRDFTSGKYKFRTTPSGKLPTDEDVVKVIKEGLAYTSMPGWPQFSDQQVRNIVYYLKTFTDDWQNAEMYGEPMEIPTPPPMTEESVTRGRQVYESQGCAACHGDLGLGDGPSARTLVDDWGNHLWPADMSYRWTFRAGPTREDIFRTFSTGLNGTPMPSYADSLAVEDRWDLVDYIYSLGESDEPNYSELLMVPYVADEIDLDNPELFDAAPMSRFPLVGQIMEVGRDFYPSATAVEVQAVYNPNEIAFRVLWHDKIADMSGSNSPTLVVPPWDEDNPVPTGADEGGDFWGDEAAEDEGDFWGEEGESDSDGFSDAVALQFPSQLPSGARKPYFIFGDGQNSVDLWFINMAGGALQQFVGRGSDALEPSEADEFEIRTGFEGGIWTVLVKRSLRGQGGISFQPEQFVPIAFSTWDGFNRERGNKRALSVWFHLYLEPVEKVSPWGPMLRAALITLVIELIVVGIVRRRRAGAPAEATGTPAGHVVLGGVS